VRYGTRLPVKGPHGQSDDEVNGRTDHREQQLTDLNRHGEVEPKHGVV
jgi:hypothetical protein